MTAAEREAFEAELRGRFDARDLEGVATRAIEGYGPEILGYLAAVLRDEDQADEVFGAFLEDLWRGLPGFRWDASFRTWAYTLARHAMLRAARSRSRVEHLPLSAVPALGTMAAQVRTTTLAHLRSHVKSAVERLRERLDPDDQALLVLRVNRKMAWGDIARILDDDPPADPAELTRRAAALRKRYERVVERLRLLSREAGLL